MHQIHLSITRKIYQKNPYNLRLRISSIFFIAFTNNKQTEWSTNTYENELSKNGIYSLFAAYRSNELNYNRFYPQINDTLAYDILKKQLIQPTDSFIRKRYEDIRRMVNYKSDSAEIHPNTIMITVESLSADLLGIFGNKENITPNLDSLSKQSILFTNLYATGTCHWKKPYLNKRSSFT